MGFVRHEVMVVLSFGGSGDASCADMLEATRLLASESFSDSNLGFGAVISRRGDDAASFPH